MPSVVKCLSLIGKGTCVVLAFILAFLFVTAVTDTVCRKIGYYDEPTEFYE